MPAVEDGAADHSDDAALIVEAAREAGQIAMRFFRKSPEVWMKGGTSPVSEADYAVDDFLRRTLLAKRPDYGWLSEETIDNPDRLGARRLYVVDPIDGTRGFLAGDTRWCVSIAVVEGGRPIAGVLDCPARAETYSATPGSGAYKNGARLFVAPAGPRPRLGGPKGLIGALPSGLLAKVQTISHVPSLAYRLAMIADRQLDATFVKANSHDWDLAAAHLIVAEAGGGLVDATGRPPSYGGTETRHGVLAAGSGRLLDLLADAIRESDARRNARGNG